MAAAALVGRAGVVHLEQEVALGHRRIVVEQPHPSGDLEQDLSRIAVQRPAIDVDRLLESETRERWHHLTGQRRCRRALESRARPAGKFGQARVGTQISCPSRCGKQRNPVQALSRNQWKSG